MSELVKIESIVIALVSVCPECKNLNLSSHDHFPDAENAIMDEVQLYYDVSCNKCKYSYRIGATISTE